MSGSKFKKEVPESRTIVPGAWSDLLDDASVSFDSEGNLTEVRVNLKNLNEIGLLLNASLMTIESQNNEIINQLKLLNEKTEEMGNTGINLNDIED